MLGNPDFAWERKLFGLAGGPQLVKKTFHNLKNVRTYLPFVAIVLGNVEPCIAALASVGLAGFEALLETLQEKRKTRDKSGLVFLLKAPQKFAKIGRRK